MTNSTRFSRLCLAAGLLLQLNSLPAAAATYYWDPLQTGQSGGGTGVWDLASSFWATAQIGGTDAPWVNGSDAVFGGTAGVVTLIDSLSLGNLAISTLGYTITTTEETSLTLSGGITANISSTRAATNINGTGRVILNGDQTISVTNALNISAVLAGSSTLTKIGTGGVGLSGANSFTGRFVVEAGLLGINSDAALGVVPSTFQADNITLNGGGLVAGTNFTGPVNFANPGFVTLDARRGITLGANGGTFRVGYGAAGTLTINGAISGSGGLTKADDATLVLSANNTYQGVTTIAAGKLQIGAGGTTGSLGSGAIAFGTGTGTYLNFNRSDNVTIANDITTGGRANISTIAGGLVTLTGAFTGAGELWMHGTGIAAINANPNSSRTSNNVIASGTLQVSDLTRTASSALGTGGLYLGQATTPSTGAGFSYTGGSVFYDGIQNLQTPYFLIEVTNPDTTLSLNGFKSAVGANLLTKRGSGTLSMEGDTDNTRMRIQVEEGTLLLGKSGAATMHAVGGADSLILNGGTVRLTGTNGDQIYDSSSVQINGGAFDLNGRNEAFNELKSTGTGGVITNDLAGTNSILTLGKLDGTGTSATSSIYTGRLRDGAGALSLQKMGTGSLTLTGTNGLSGGTSVTSGRLIVSGSLTGSATHVFGGTDPGGAFMGGVLGGTGTVGDIIVLGGVVSPGASAGGAAVGTLKTGSLDMSGNGIFEVAIDTGALASSLVEIQGDLSLGFFAAVLSLTEVGSATALADGTKFTLMSYTGQWDQGTFLFGNIGDIADGSTFTFGLNTYQMDYDAAGYTPGEKEVVLTVVVPEPTVGGLLLGGLALLGGWRRRKAAARV